MKHAYYILIHKISCRTTKRMRKKMEIPTIMYNIFPSKKREELISKRNIRVIKEFLKNREKLEIAKKEDASHLKQLRKTKSISSSNYQRLKKVLFYSHEEI